MPRTISDEEDRYLQERRSVADFVESIYNDPTLNKDAKRLIKKKYPNIQIPDLDIEDKLESRFDADKKHREEESRKQRQKAEDERLKEERARVKKEYGFTDEAMKELEQFMIDKGVDDYDVAATYKASKSPKASEPTNDNRFWDHDKQEGFAEIAKDPEKWGEKEILRALRADEARAKQWR